MSGRRLRISERGNSVTETRRPIGRQHLANANISLSFPPSSRNGCSATKRMNDTGMGREHVVSRPNQTTNHKGSGRENGGRR